MDDEYILELMVNQGRIDETQAEEVRWKAEEENKNAAVVVEELGFASEDELLQLLAAEYNMDTFDLSDYRIPDEVIEKIPGDVAKRYHIVPVMAHDSNITVAICDPTKFIEVLDSLNYILHTSVEAVVTKREHIQKAIDTYYGSTEEAVDRFIHEVTSGEIDVEIGAEQLGEGEADLSDDSPIIKLVSLIIMEAYKSRASDIHLEPLEKRFRIRYRIDGVLLEMENPPKYLQNNIIQRLKIMSRMDITEHRVPQDGRILFKMPGKSIDLRVSDVPTVHGESIVMRILDKTSVQLGIPELGFFHDDQELIDRIINFPDGIFLVTGPTGSGKTTSLYAFLNTLNTPNRKIITVEDPVEYELSGINQVQCDPIIGLTFSTALRSMLRQAPNIVMVGEIRDLETGSVAINAALTGHLVFSTLHTNDAPTAVTRLIDIGVKPFLVASSVRAIMAQRLLRKVCKTCASPVGATEDELRVLEVSADFFDDANLQTGSGCNDCKNGYKGRMGIFEILLVEETIVQLIFKASATNAIRQQARELGMRTLREDGLRKASAGLTSLAEVVRITKIVEEEG